MATRGEMDSGRLKEVGYLKEVGSLKQ